MRSWALMRREYARGRFEGRRCTILSAEAGLDKSFPGHWPGLHTLVKVEANRYLPGQTRYEARCCISGETELNPLCHGNPVRGHWSVGNHLHWHLDVTFHGDACRVRRGNGPENPATMRQLALQPITQQTDRLGLQKRRVSAAYGMDYLKSVIT